MPNQQPWTDMPQHACVIVPVGSFEQHGPHLPLDTDTQIANYLSESIATAQAEIVIAPPVAITASGEHAGFPGTISIGTEVLSSVFVEIVRSCDWAQGVIFVHGHGGNLEATHIASQVLHHEKRNFAHWWPRIADADAHAGNTETSMMLAINPTAVRMDRLSLGNNQPISEIQHQLRTHGVKAVSSNGVIGDARLASAEIGKEIMRSLVRDLHDFTNSMRSRWQCT